MKKYILGALLLAFPAFAGPNSPCYLKGSTAECIKPIAFGSGGTSGYGQRFNAPLISDGFNSTVWNRAASFQTSGLAYTPVIWSTGFGGLQYSIDNANNWKTVTTSFATQINNVYQQGPLVLGGYHGGVSGGLYYSTDFGNTFTTITAGTSNLPSGADLRVFPINGRYFAVSNSGISWSDNLTTWTVSTGLTINNDVLSVWDNQNGVLVTNDVNAEAYQSTDNGASWSALPIVGIGTLRTLNAQQNVIYACTDTGLWKTVNLGTNWTKIEANSCYMAHLSGPRIYTQENSQYIRGSLDGGKTWPIYYDFGYPGAIYAFAIVGSRLYADGDDPMRYSDNNGTSWTAVPTQPTGSQFYLNVQGGAQVQQPFTGVTRDWSFRERRLQSNLVACNTTANVTTDPLRLGPGVWEIEGYIGFEAGASITAKAAISTTSATLPGNDTLGVSDSNGQIMTQATVATRSILPFLRSEVTLLENKTFYLVCDVSSATSVWGSIKATQK